MSAGSGRWFLGEAGCTWRPEVPQTPNTQHPILARETETTEGTWSTCGWRLSRYKRNTQAWLEAIKLKLLDAHLAPCPEQEVPLRLEQDGVWWDKHQNHWPTHGWVKTGHQRSEQRQIRRHQRLIKHIRNVRQKQRSHTRMSHAATRAFFALFRP